MLDELETFERRVLTGHEIDQLFANDLVTPFSTGVRTRVRHTYGDIRIEGLLLVAVHHRHVVLWTDASLQSEGLEGSLN